MDLGGQRSISLPLNTDTMGGPNIPRVEELQRPERLQEVLAKDRPEDCTPCRITGTRIWRNLLESL